MCLGHYHQPTIGQNQLRQSLSYNKVLNIPGGSDGQESARNVGDQGSAPWVRKIRWRRKWQPTAVFLPGESQGQWSLVGYSPQGREGSDRTEVIEHTHHAMYAHRRSHCRSQDRKRIAPKLPCAPALPLTPGNHRPTLYRCAPASRSPGIRINCTLEHALLPVGSLSLVIPEIPARGLDH